MYTCVFCVNRDILKGISDYSYHYFQHLFTIYLPKVSMLCRLQHANIIQFIGVCHSPLCFVIELAPQGSLQGILEKKQRQRDEHADGLVTDSHLYGSLLGRFISYKIAFQVLSIFLTTYVDGFQRIRALKF